MMSLLRAGPRLHAGEGLDWTGRGRVAGVSNESVAETRRCVIRKANAKGYRLICQRKRLGMIATRVRLS